MLDETQRKDQGEAVAKATRALFMKSDFQTIINSDQMLKATYSGTPPRRPVSDVKAKIGVSASIELPR